MSLTARVAVGLSLVAAGCGLALAADLASTAGASGAEIPCRCRPLSLESYYVAADEVVMGRLVASREQQGDLLLEFEVAEGPWKLAAARPDAVRPGDTIRYLTADSTGECGLGVRMDAIYVLFASEPYAADTIPRLDSCSGSRVFREATATEPEGFLDVPGRFVVAQLHALSGLAFLARASALAPDPSDPANEVLIGLLDLPAFSHGGWVQVRDAPREDAEVLDRPASYDGLASKEVSYEVGSAVAFARIDGWTRVRLADGRFGWISPEESGTWFPYAELPVQRLAYLTGAWSGHVWPDPGAGIPARSSLKGASDREEYAVEVLDAYDVAGTTWFRIELLSESPCYDPEARTVLTGWVPAHGEGGQPVAWFYSRGC